MFVIGTAGHIDHGKSALVERLTGIDPDRLSEEKDRGMTIDLGFAWLTLPSGATVSVVDVPGHERFVKNMLAGAGGIDVALLVVAADEGVMPQTREHLGIIDLLGIGNGVVALTKADLVDKDLLELVGEDVLEVLSGTTLRHAPVIPVSSVTGEGIDALLTELDRIVGNLSARPSNGVAHVPIDRVFTISGFGTVVTGTLHGGVLRTGQEVEIVPGSQRGRIRGLQVHRQSADSVGPGTRVAVNLAGIGHDSVHRGQVLALPHTVQPVRRFDARIRVLPDAARPLRNAAGVALHAGAAEVGATLHLFGQKELLPGQEGWARLRTSSAVTLLRGQRFVLRLPSPIGTVAGGEVADIFPSRRQQDADSRERLAGLLSGDVEDVVMAVLGGNRAVDEGRIAALAGLDRDIVHAALLALSGSELAVRLESAYISRRGWEAIERRAREILESFHLANPLRPGMPRGELRSMLKIAPGMWNSALKRLVAGGAAHIEGTLVRSPGHAGGLQSRRADADRVLAVLRREPYSPPSGAELIARSGADPELLTVMCGEGDIVRVDVGLYFESLAYERLVEATLDEIETNGQITVAALRDRFGTSRKYALALLEHLDGEHVTRRVGDVRVAGSKRPACA